MEGRPQNHGGKILSTTGLVVNGSDGGFRLQSTFKPTGDQPKAIDALTRGVLEGERNQTLLGVTGSGKTFSVANVVERVQRPTLVLSHNKTLAAQLYQEFKSFFPGQRRRVLRKLLRLLPARGLPAEFGHLHREGPQHQRRNRKTQALDHLIPIKRTTGRTSCCLGQLPLWHGEPRSLQKPAGPD